MKQFLLCILVTFCLFSAAAQENAKPQTVSQTNRVAITRIMTQIKSFPQEKIYLQLDRPYYSAGDRIWFRAYMVHATLHSPLLYSRYIYVELLNEHNEVLLRKKVRPNEEHAFYSQMDLSADLAQGWYSIRAYTNFMRNQDEGFFFRKKIYVGNGLRGLSGVTINEKTAANMGKNQDKRNTGDAYSVQFFPEGGHLIAGATQTIAFKALAPNGLGTEVLGKIVDQNGTSVANFRSNKLGMGSLTAKWESGKSYVAQCENLTGQKLAVNLPAPSKENIAVSVQQTSENVNLKILTAELAGHTDSLHIVGCMRGLPVFQASLAPGVNEFTTSKAGFSSGVYQLFVLNVKGDVLCERLFFIHSKDQADLSLRMDKPNYQKRDAAHASIVLKDSKGNPVEGSFSVSITDDNDARIDSSDLTIKSYMLLQSELKGYIEKPEDYFRPDNKNAASDLDVLMMTQGWKRYDIPAAIQGNYAKCDQYEIERGPVITGRVQSLPSKRGVSGNNVSLMFAKKFQFDGTTTDSKGYFQFQCAEFPDSTQIRIDATKKVAQFLELVVNQDSFPQCSLSYPFPENMKQLQQFNSFLKKSRDRYYYQNGMMSVNLDKIVVTAKKQDVNKKVRERYSCMYSDASYSLSGDNLETASSIIDALSMCPGVTTNATNDGVLIRNAIPLIMVNNMEYSMEDLRTINPNEVKLIDILKDPGQTAIFGSKGGNGVICLYLKTAEDIKSEPVVLGKHQALVMPLGYAVPAEFYVPKYQVESVKQDPLPDLRSTIYWKPDVKTNVSGEADLFFYTADNASTYSIVIEGMTPKGEIIRYQSKMNRK